MVGIALVANRLMREDTMKLLIRSTRYALLLATCAGSIVAGGCGTANLPQQNSFESCGNPIVGKKLIISSGCGACHTIPGIYTARGLVGPPLNFYSRRTMIAGELPNTPDNLVRWLMDPPAIEPETAMPNMGLSEQQARDIAAYLYTLR